jgi:hypothetical protein
LTGKIVACDPCVEKMKPMAARSSEAFTAATPQSSPATNRPPLRAVRHRHLRPGFGTLTFEIVTGCHG